MAPARMITADGSTCIAPEAAVPKMFACAPFVNPYRALYEGGVVAFCMLLPEAIQRY